MTIQDRSNGIELDEEAKLNRKYIAPSGRVVLPLKGQEEEWIDWAAGIVEGYVELMRNNEDLKWKLHKQLGTTPMESKFLALLINREGTVMTKEQLLDGLYERIDEPQLKIIDVYACKVRAKIRQHDEKGGNFPYTITTFWGRGYCAELIKGDHPE